ncbi:uncharacterized protein LOC125662695 [Ostrea edulis]|uniref:uncharacterized protein LOC125662695 n=1 Tax=Ostrea edulis TaxID=37623 RepID=UPI0020944A4B|nr:uncharacterized protein LOC125662695 [Ostrea edulis]
MVNPCPLMLTGIMFSVCFAADTYQDGDCALKIQKNGMSLLNEGMKLIDPDIKIAGRFHEALRDLYQNVNKEHTLNITKTYLQNITIESNGTTFHAIDGFNKKRVFEKRYIYLYTTMAVYKKLNSILREHDCTTNTLSEGDLYYAPYSAVLMSVLMYWSNLTEFRGLTYRGADLPETDINKYTVNKRFVWTQFTSTSTNKSNAFDRNVTFIIYNNQSSPYMAPKPVYLFAWKPELDEAIYCPGAEFEVLRVEKNISDSVGSAIITLQTVISTSDSGDCRRQPFMLNIIALFIFLLSF